MNYSMVKNEGMNDQVADVRSGEDDGFSDEVNNETTADDIKNVQTRKHKLILSLLMEVIVMILNYP